MGCVRTTLWWILIFHTLISTIHASDVSTRRVFAEIDADDDGDLDDAEISAYLSVHADEYTSTDVLKSLDSDSDSLIYMAELEKSWDRLATLNTLSVEEWLESAVGLPRSVARTFSDVNFHDLPLLLDKKVLDERNLSALHRSALERSVKLLVLGVGRTPTEARRATGVFGACDARSIVLNFESSPASPPIHTRRMRVLCDGSVRSSIAVVAPNGSVEAANPCESSEKVSLELVEWSILGRAVTSTNVRLPYECHTYAWTTILALVGGVVFLARARRNVRRRSGADVERSSRPILTVKANSTNRDTPPASPATPNTEKQVSYSRCFVCDVKLKGFTRRHVCGSCHRVYCNEHTKSTDHSRLTTCNVRSNCRCAACYDFAHPTSPRSRKPSETSKWSLVRKHFLLKRTLSAWKKKE